ncbi:hypothetical protein E0Z10_g9526 [Xylaria hypoxylon]|uniref:Uncharacterized protein n=1 Tax=Xylaria hypoxylon TaxID=37992 RepID=A0A4Z0YK74_9PEZI|nr:hypothetical protein E0Z10_g9526 [Xylaria hypoxylon]
MSFIDQTVKMSADSAPQFVVPPSLSTYARPETLSGPANPSTECSALEALSSDGSNHTLVGEAQSPSNDSTVCQDTNAEPVVHEVSLPTIPTYKALGLLSITILAGGTIIVLAALSFLVFLWYGEGSGIGGEHATSTWRRIMLRDSLPQVITLTSLAMRVTIAAQTTLCTSMCAALILERRRVRKSQAAQFSIARSVNDGPWKLILTLLQDVPTHISLCPESILIVLLGVAALGTQFTSTILLWDLGDASLAQFPSTTLLNLSAAADTLMEINTPYWSQRPRAFASFGESPPGYFAQPNQHGMSDTGLKRRVLLPFSDVESRTSLRSYEGQAFVQSSRVACMAPIFSNTQFMATDYRNLFYYGIIDGDIQYEETFAQAGIPSSRLCNSKRCLPSSFSCGIYTKIKKAGKGSDDDSFIDSFCFPDLINMTAFSASYWNLNDDPWGPEASTVLVITSELDEGYWNESLGQTIPTPNYTVDGEWANFELKPRSFVNISLCFMGLNVMFSDVNLTSTADKTTDTAEKKANMFGLVINTTDIQMLLGADPSIQSLTERGVFEIERIEDDPGHIFIARTLQSFSLGQNNTSLMESCLINIAQSQTPNATISVCDPCDGYPTQSANPLYANIFSYILRRSNRAAVALQSVYTILGQTVYYDLLEKYDQPYETHVTSSKTVKTPRKSLGLIVVIILVVLSLVAVGTMTALFSRHSRCTLLGESWHTLSQVVSFETEVILKEKDILPDGIIRRDVKGEDYYVKLARSSISGRVEVVRFDAKT